MNSSKEKPLNEIAEKICLGRLTLDIAERTAALDPELGDEFKMELQGGVQQLMRGLFREDSDFPKGNKVNEGPKEGVEDLPEEDSEN